MRRYVAYATLALAALVLAAGCGSKESSSSSSGGGSTSSNSSGSAYGGGGSNSASSSAKAAMVKTAKVELGTVLVGPNGRTLYLFEKDRGTTSACSGACAQAWPPLTTNGAPKASGPVKATLLGTTKRGDGTTQITYAGHPLYYYKGDSAAGQTNGQGSEAFGAEWYVLAPSGKKVEES